MNRSQIRATANEMEEIKRLHQAASGPVLAIGGGFGQPTDHWRVLLNRLDELATGHGLAPQQGEWGLDLETGEFLSNHPIVEGPRPHSDDAS